MVHSEIILSMIFCFFLSTFRSAPRVESISQLIASSAALMSFKLPVSNKAVVLGDKRSPVLLMTDIVDAVDRVDDGGSGLGGTGTAADGSYHLLFPAGRHSWY